MSESPYNKSNLVITNRLLKLCFLIIVPIEKNSVKVGWLFRFRESEKTTIVMALHLLKSENSILSKVVLAKEQTP